MEPVAPSAQAKGLFVGPPAGMVTLRGIDSKAAHHFASYFHAGLGREIGCPRRDAETKRCKTYDEKERLLNIREPTHVIKLCRNSARMHRAYSSSERVK